MRVVEEWTEQNIRVTVLVMNGKYSLKLESNLLEQTYKFRDGQIENLEQLKGILTPAFFKNCRNSFIHMDLQRSLLFPSSDETEQFAEII